MARLEPGHAVELQQPLPHFLQSSTRVLSPALPRVCGGLQYGQTSNFRRMNLGHSFQPILPVTFSMFCYLFVFPISYAGFAFSLHVLLSPQYPGLTNISHPTPCFLLFPVFFHIYSSSFKFILLCSLQLAFIPLSRIER